MVTATDLFAGGGGSPTGLTRAGFQVVAAANHWPVAIATHQANHPDTEHHTANLSETDFRRFPTTDLLWASPSCVWHARAGGRKRPPVDIERARAAGATDVEIHDTVLIAAAFCMFNRYVDGLGTWQPDDPSMYRESGRRTAELGYVNRTYPPVAR